MDINKLQNPFYFIFWLLGTNLRWLAKKLYSRSYLKSVIEEKERYEKGPYFYRTLRRGNACEQ